MATYALLQTIAIAATLLLTVCDFSRLAVRMRRFVVKPYPYP